ncbi:MAG: hypothetical protein ACKOOF_10225, partial [Planctomycetaceae bacterium]
MKRQYEETAATVAFGSRTALGTNISGRRGTIRMRSGVSPWTRVWFVGFLLLAWTNAVHAADLGSQIVKLTGARTKFAWVRSTPLGNPKEAKPKMAFSLMGFDTQDNKEHEILSGLEGNVYPWITHDGAR